MLITRKGKNLIQRIVMVRGKMVRNQRVRKVVKINFCSLVLGKLQNKLIILQILSHFLRII
mgnify:CR=1 FL=1